MRLSLESDSVMGLYLKMRKCYNPSTPQENILPDEVQTVQQLRAVDGANHKKLAWPISDLSPQLQVRLVQVLGEDGNHAVSTLGIELRLCESGWDYLIPEGSTRCGSHRPHHP